MRLQASGSPFLGLPAPAAARQRLQLVAARPPGRTERGEAEPLSIGRRQALLAAAAGWAASQQLQARVLAATDVEPATAGSFYSQWQYVEPADILPYIRATARAGDVDSVLAAIDTFASFFPMYRCGPEEGAILEALARQQRPQLALELGTFMGYGAARLARNLPPGGRLITVEAGEEQAAVALQVLQYAGLPAGTGPEDRIQIVTGLSGDVLPRLRQLAGLPADAAFEFVWLDHCKPCLEPDLTRMERLALIAPGSMVVADNVLIPGAPDYLAHVGAGGSLLSGSSGGAAGSAGPSRSSSGGDSGEDAVGVGSQQEAGSSSSTGLRYRTELRYAAFEVEERYKKDWQPKRDAMAVSVVLGGAPLPAAPA